MFIVSAHIPKTAGTTLANIFDASFRRRIIYDYDGYENPSIPSAEISENAGFICKYFRVIHGHFMARKYFDVFQNAKFVSCVRHPVDRVVSQYLHELNEDSSESWYHDDIVSGKMDVVDFASIPDIASAMTLHLEGREIEDYDFIFVTEDMISSLHIFSAMIVNLDLENLYGSPPSIPRLNESSSRKLRKEFKKSVREKIFLQCPSDVDIYARAASLLNERKKKLGI